MSAIIRQSVRLMVLVTLVGSSTGCFLQTLSGIRAALDGSLITSLETDAQLTTCVQSGSTGGNVECTYFFLDANGVPVSVTSSTDLISEFGVLGVVIDPLIVQIPGNATDVTATYDDGNGNSGDLVVQSGYRSIPADISRTLFAEPGTQFVIAELPDGVAFDGVAFTFTLGFSQPMGSAPAVLKPLLALRYEANNQIFYPPMLPCETDMANVAAVTVPDGSVPVPVNVPGDPVGCPANHQYLLLGFGVFPCDFDGDDDVDRDDIALQAAVRNAPALPGDRLDTDGDGTIDIFDVRACVLQCTLSNCRVPVARVPLPHLIEG